MEALSRAHRAVRAHRCPPTAWSLLAVVLAVAAAVPAWLLTAYAGLSLLLGARRGFALPFLKITHDRKRALRRSSKSSCPMRVDVIKRALRAGHPFSPAIKLVAEDMDEPDRAASSSTTFADINYGNDLRRAMLGLLQRVPSVTMMALVTAVLVQKETGGNLAEILEQITTGHPRPLPLLSPRAHAVGGRPHVRMDSRAGARSCCSRSSGSRRPTICPCCSRTRLAKI